MQLETMEETKTKIYEKLDYFIQTNKIPNIIFHGPSGSGKRTIVHNFLFKIYQNDREKMKSNITKEDLKYNGLLLKEMINQTEDDCITAVKQNGTAIIYAKYLTEEVKLAAVKQNGNAIQYIKKDRFVHHTTR